MIDLRSDTVTRPTAEMRRVMAAADVGDDVYHDDPEVNRLEELVAGLLGKEDAVFVPTGTMSNQIAVRTHTEPGDVVLLAEHAHIAEHEIGAPAALAGVSLRALPGEAGTFTAAAVRAAVPAPPPSLPAWLGPPVTLVAVENTHNEAGGTPWPTHLLREVTAVAAQLGLATHLDGARLWNAAVASGVPEVELAAGFDTVSVCFSKGLGAPVGSALAGSRELVPRARRFKQMYGGGFRQAGILAAAALYALEHNVERLAADHARARRLAAGLAEIPGLHVDPATVRSNIVMVHVEPQAPDPAALCAAVAGDVLAIPFPPRKIRLVTHLDVDDAGIERALVGFRTALGA